MDTLLTDFRTHCLEATLDLLWRQWCSLGVAGHSRAADPGRLIDPEALILATTSIGRHEPRMFDEALDWLGSHGSLVNLQRLKNLQHLCGLGQPNVLGAVASWLRTRASQQKWKILVQTSRRKPGASEPLFLGLKGPAGKTSDPCFLAHGLERSVFQPRGMSRAPHPTSPPNLVMILRALIGVSARVEIILFLSGGGAAHASEIAHATGYAPRTLQALLQEMQLSGRLLSQEPSTQSSGKIRRGSNRRYHMQSSDWSFLTNGQPLPRWTPWAALLALIQSVLSAIPCAGAKPRHPAVISSQLRDALAQHGHALAAAGLLPLIDLRPEAPGDELLQTLADRLPKAIASL